MAIITQDDLLQYLYKETSAEKTLYIRTALETDADLKERMQVLRAGKDRLEKIKLLSPDSRVLDKIFSYAGKEMKELS